MISIRNFIALLAAVFALNAFAAVDVNKATQAELETVKGIGPGLSAKILKAREAGSFKNWADLVDRVGGVGPGNASRFSQAGLTVGGSAYDGAAPAPKGEKEAKAPKARKDGTEGKADKAEKTKKGSKTETPAA
jgi:competence protein ComEA